jgi:hypothetical protein
MIGDIFEKSEHKEIAALYYGNILKNYPLSELAPSAKNKLVEFKVPVPQADPKAMAWMTAEQNTPRQRDGLVKKPLALVRSGPHQEMVASAKHGTPTLEPEADNTSATDILTGGNRSQLGGSSGPGNTAVVETVTPGGAAPAPTAATEAATPADAAAPAAGTGSEQPAKADSSATGGSQEADAAKTDGSQTSDDKKDSKKESSSKKKKGLHKVVPW